MSFSSFKRHVYFTQIFMEYIKVHLNVSLINQNFIQNSNKKYVVMFFYPHSDLTLIKLFIHMWMSEDL